MSTSPFAWYLDLTPNQLFSDFYAYPLPWKTGLPLCQEHRQWLELKEAVVYDEEANSDLHGGSLLGMPGGMKTEQGSRLLRCDFGREAYLLNFHLYPCTSK
jgi:hypothetical protein